MVEDYKKHYSLLCPGPINVSQRVLSAMQAYEIGHREAEFSALLKQIRCNLLTVAGLDPQKYSCVIITGSGSAGNEAVLSSALKPTDQVLSLSNGEFGRRLGDIAEIYCTKLMRQEQPWASTLDLVQLESTLQSTRIDWITMVHHETSTGELQPVAEVGALCAKYGTKLFVDAVSSFMADPIDLSACNVNFMTSSSGKALGMPPGLALVIGKKEDFETLSQIPPRNYYLNLARHYAYHEQHAQTPNTPAIHLFIALNEALLQILEEGVQNRFAHQSAKAQMLRAGLAACGLELYRPEAKLSNAVSSVRLPPQTNFEALRETLRAHQYVIYSGKGPLLGKIAQISTMGAIDDALINQFIDCFVLALHEQGAVDLPKNMHYTAQNRAKTAFS